ncbi:MAG: hypothetical protein IAC78_03360 [Firmicutes bacterium]|uniref:FeoB-associated Cys-rich membrane protein n=1 Tax=Candidatus Scatoplasma merdavium TaxID=2840932 RepID=A0A9D9D9U7_9BACL|nr:hypothetical protein [Candidatus Scatoplasma merdavium]
MPTYLKVILAIVLVGSLIAIFVISYLINKKTKAPDDCPKDIVGCAGCMLSCGKREEEFKVSSLVQDSKEDNRNNTDKGEK